METVINKKFHGPHSGVLAILYTLLFITGLSFVISFISGNPHFPSPWESAAVIVTYFRQQPHDVLLCGFFQFCSAIPLGLLTVTLVAKLRFLGVKAVGPWISLFGGLLTAVNMSLSALLAWVTAFPGVADDGAVIRALYYVSFAIGGIGFSVPFGLLVAGIAVSGGFANILNKALVWSDIGIALVGEASCLSLVFPKLVFLIPLTRFPGFIWLIWAGFRLASRRRGSIPA